MCNDGLEKKKNKICNVWKKDKELWECKIGKDTKENGIREGGERKYY